MLAMASSSQNDRLQAKERRNKVTPTVGASLGGAVSIEPASTDDGDLFPVPVRVKPSQHDELSNRIKDCFSNAHSNSPNPMPPRQPQPNHMDHQQRVDGHGRPSNHIQQPPPPNLPAQSDKDKSGSGKDRDSKKKSEGSEHKHKHKDREKEKKRKSSSHTSEERHPKKKSKSSEKSHSPPTKDQSSLPPPKKISHRSSSVSSDRSDHSVKSRSSVDKHYSKHSGSHSTTNDHSSSHTKSSKSNKHSSSGSHHTQSASNSATNNSSVSTSSTHNPNTSISQQHPTSNNSHSSTHGATNYNYKGAAHSSIKTTSTSSGSTSGHHDMNLVSATLFNNHSSGKSNSHISGKSTEKDSRPINGLIRTKPTNLVIPSRHPDQQSTSIKGDKDDLPIKYILEEMIKPTAEKITEIQTPCKVDNMHISPFSNLPKAIEPMLTLKSSSKTNLKNNNNTETKEREKLAPIKAPVKPNKQANGVIDDLNLSPSASDSDSSSSSDNSSSSSSSSSSDSESSDDEAAPPILFPELQRSPAPSTVPDQTGSSDMWDLGNFMTNNTSTKQSLQPTSKTTTVSSKFSSLSTQANKTIANSIEPPVKKKRGRPRKEETARKNPDPDFMLPAGGKQPPTVTSIVATDRKKRISSSSKSKSDGPNQLKKKRGRPPKNREEPMISKAPPTLSSPDSSSSNSTPFLPSPPHTSTAATVDKISPTPALSMSSFGRPGATEDEDVDVDVDVVSDRSPYSNHSATSFKSIKTESPKKPKPELFLMESKVESKLAFPKHEPISPVDVKPMMFDDNKPVTFEDNKPMTFEDTKPVVFDSKNIKDISSLPISIPFLKLLKLPRGAAKSGRQSHSSGETRGSSTAMMEVPSLTGTVSENLSPPLSKRKAASPISFPQALLNAKKSEDLSPPLPKCKITSPLSFSQALIEVKKNKSKASVDPVKTDDSSDITMNHVKVTGPSGRSSGSKDISRSTSIRTLPVFENSIKHHERARDLKSKYTSLASGGGYSSNRPFKNLFALESVVAFMMSGICRELEEPKGIQSVKSYYSSTLHLAESQLNDSLKDQITSVPHRSIHRCCHVLSLFVLAHLRHKCYKLSKDPISSASKRIDEHLKDKSRSGISPHNCPVLPGSSPAAPSPASITSTHSHSSVASESGRSSSLPPLSGLTVSVPESILKDVGDYMKCMSYLSTSVETYRQADCMKDLTEMNNFFRRLDEDIGYSIGMLTDSKQYVHYINIACARLRSDLTAALMNNTYS